MKFIKFRKKKVFAYENSEGDKGVIIANSLEAAKRSFHRQYPERKIVNNDDDYWKNGAYLYEVDNVENNSLYCCFPW